MPSPHLGTNVLPPLLCIDAMSHCSVQSAEGMNWLRAFYESQLTRDWGACNPVMRAASLAGILEVQRYQALQRVRDQVLDLRNQLPSLTLIRKPAELSRLCQMMDATILMLQDVWDPERTSFMEQLRPIQVQLRRLAELPAESGQ